VLLHVGLPKTGTTSIQQALYNACKNNDLDGVCYPLIDNKIHHHDIVTIFMAPDRLLRWHKSIVRTTEELRKIRERVKGVIVEALGRKNDVILSSEFLSAMNHDEIASFKRYLEQSTTGSIKVLMYVRSPPDYYLSFVQQQIKASSTFANPVDYRQRIKGMVGKWVNAFPGVVEIRSYDRSIAESGSLLTDFGEVCRAFFGKPLTNSEKYPSSLNRSLSAEAMIIVQEYRKTYYPHEDNMFMPDSNRLVRILQAARDDFPQTTARLKPVLASHIIANHREDLEFLRETYGITFDLAGQMGTNDVPRGNYEKISSIIDSHDEALLRRLLIHVIRARLT